jgi:hypothetical protein
MRQHIIGCLLDLLENPKTALHLLEWRTKKDSKKGIEHELISIWCQEEIRIGVKENDLGITDNKTQFPLKGVQTADNKTLVEDGSLAINELQFNLRVR